MKSMSKINLFSLFFLGVFLAVFFLLFVSVTQAQVIGNWDFLDGIVPCGRCAQFGPGQSSSFVCLVPSAGATSAQATPCTICHFYKLLQNIINFLLFTSSALITLMAIYIAFLFLFSGGSPKMIEDAKSKLWLLVWGIIWVLGSWLVLNTIITFFADSSVFPAPWHQINC